MLTRQWRDTDAGVELVFWASTSRGPLRLQLTGQDSVCFINRDATVALPRGARRNPVELRRLGNSQLAVDALYFRSQRQLSQWVAQAKDPDGLAETDIKPTDRYLMERFVTASFNAVGEIVDHGGWLSIDQPHLSRSEYAPELRVASIDIETQGLTGQLYSIAIVDESTGQVFMQGTDSALTADGYTVHFFPDERQLLLAFISAIAALDPDVLIGWNVVDFDLDYLARRCQQLQIPFALGRRGENAAVLQPRFAQQPRVARVPGRVVLDGIDLLRAGFWAFERFSLDHVARVLLGEGKLIGDDVNKPEQIDRLFLSDKPALAAYNVMDCVRVRQIFATAKLIDFAIQRATLTGLPIDRSGGSVAAFDNLYLPRLHRQGYVANNVSSQGNDQLTSPGGYVMDSQPGLYQNVLLLDFKSLYPSIIRTFLIDPLGLAEPGYDPVPGFDGGRFSRHLHILPSLIEQLWQQRDRAKADKNGPLSQAIKIIMNSFYGVLGTSRCRFHDHRLTSSITRRGHEIITLSRDHIEEQGHQVIYGDTDSLFVLLGPDHTPLRARQLGAELAQKLTLWWAHKLRVEHGLDSALEVEFESHFQRFLMPTIRGAETGSKKRYAGAVVNADGQQRLVFKGLEAARTDWTPLAREFQRELYRRIFNDEPFEEYVRQTADQLRAGELDDKLIYRKQLRRALADYQRNVPPHVQAARQLPRAGRSIEYVITVDGPQPVELKRSALDYRHYLDKQLAPAADGILHFLGTRFAALTTAQITLF